MKLQEKTNRCGFLRSLCGFGSSVLPSRTSVFLVPDRLRQVYPVENDTKIFGKPLEKEEKNGYNVRTIDFFCIFLQ